ncbi:MAG: DUF932 domain-containing protein, partial [Nanoarchaeota archaeon]
CSNGMTLGKVLNNIREVTFHVGKEKHKEMISQTTEKFIKQVINSSERLQQYVNNAIGDSIEWETLDKIFEKLAFREKHQEEIKLRLEGIQHPTRWQVYNAVTNYLTHDEHLTPNVQSYLENKAEKLLKNNFEYLEALEVAR